MGQGQAHEALARKKDNEDRWEKLESLRASEALSHPMVQIRAIWPHVHVPTFTNVAWHATCNHDMIQV